jgi:hypothetical protein
VSVGSKADEALELDVPRRSALAGLWAAVRTPAGAATLVGGLMLASFVARVLLARHVLAPWEMPDELLYAKTSRGFLSSGHYLFREEPKGLRTIYPALISPAWLAGSTHTAYTLIKVINAALMTLGAIPLYLWARRLVAPFFAVFAVVLYLAMPGFMYTAEILTENAFLPATMLAFFAMAVALERPSLLRQVLALGAIALAAAARIQGVVFLLVLPTAIGLTLLLDAVAAAPPDRRRTVVGKLRRFWPSFGAVALAVVGYVVYELGRGRKLSQGLGIYEQISTAHYAFRPALRWIAYHFGELAFSVGLIPVSALIVLFGLACRRATAPSSAERAFLAVTTAAVFWVVVQVGTFASQFSLRVEERYMFNLGPALFLALVIWLARGLPRPPALTAAAVLAPAALLLALPYQGLFTVALFNDTYGLIPLWRLSVGLGTNAGDVPIIVGAGALAAGLLFASLRRAWARFAVPAAVAGFLVLSSAAVFAVITWQASSTRYAGGLTGDPSWIDHAVGKNARVEFLYTTEIDRNVHMLWQSEFWNRSVRRVFGVTSQDPSIPDTSTPLNPVTGRISSALPADSPDRKPRFVVAAGDVAVAGKRIAQAGFLALYRVTPPLGLASSTWGVEPDAWTGSSASYTAYRGSPERHINVLVRRPPLTGPPPARVSIEVGSMRAVKGTPRLIEVWARERWTVRNGTRHLFTLPLRRGPFLVRLTVDPTFVPTQYGLSDTRTLGVQVSFAPY